MELLKAINSRKSVRSYTGEPLSEDQINTLLKAALAAPVGGGQFDKVHLTVVTDKELLGEIDKCCAIMFGNPDISPLHGAPVLIVVSASSEKSADVASADTGAIVENMSLAATDMGIGSLFVWGAMAAVRGNEELLAKLNLPEGYVIYGSMAAGITAEELPEREIPADKIEISYI